MRKKAKFYKKYIESRNPLDQQHFKLLRSIIETDV